MKAFLSTLLLVSTVGIAAADRSSSVSNGKQSFHSDWDDYGTRTSVRYESAGYHHKRPKFKCFNAWGERLPGKFYRDEKRLIEMGGGTCRKGRKGQYNNGVNGDLSAIYRTGFPVENVHRAIREIRREYGLYQSRFIEAKRVKNGSKNYKYTLVFKVKGQGIREFRVKHRQWSGEIKNIKEVYS